MAKERERESMLVCVCVRERGRTRLACSLKWKDQSGASGIFSSARPKTRSPPQFQSAAPAIYRGLPLTDRPLLKIIDT
jgi:hypothetical protein